MKNLFLLLIMLAAFVGCRKEGEILPQLQLENLYEIKNNSSDSIQKRVYDIYDRYGVTVVFNDTLGKVFVKQDIKGDSVFTYETVDPAWGFTGYANVDYYYTYLTDPDEQSKMLDVVEKFLNRCSKVLYPQVILLLDSYYTEASNGSVETFSDGGFLVTYRSLLLCNAQRPNVLASLPEDIMRTFIIQRISDYTLQLASFHRLSKDYIGKSWEAIGAVYLKEPITYEEDGWWGPEVYTVTQFRDAPLYNTASCLQDDWWGLRDYDLDLVEKFRKAVRQLIGPYGFVSQTNKGAGNRPPEDEKDDLQLFVKEMLRFSKAEFKKLWGDSELVMQKYDILYDLLSNELGVKL